MNTADWLAEIKIEAMLAKSLQLRGYTPIVVTDSSNKHAVRYFRLFGIGQFMFFDQLMREQPLQSFAESAAGILDGRASFNSVLNYRFNEVDAGRFTLSTVARRLRDGSPAFSDPRVVSLLRNLLPQSMAAAEAAKALLGRTKPSLLVTYEKGYSPYGELFDVAVSSGVDSIQWQFAHRPDGLLFKRYNRNNSRLHPYSVSPETWERCRDMPWSDAHDQAVNRELVGRYQDGTWHRYEYAQVDKRLKPPEEVRRQLRLDPQKKTAVVFSHILWDATFFYGDNLFDDYEHWLVETVKAARANDRVNWVIKLHPDLLLRWKMSMNGATKLPELAALDLQVGDLPDHIKILPPETDVSIFSLAQVTDYCVTVRGTVGIELSALGIPVLTAGTGRYSGLGFTIDSQTRAEYLKKLSAIQDLPGMSPEQALLARKHAYVLFVLRPWVFNTFELAQLPLAQRSRVLGHNIRVLARSFNELRDAPDLQAFAAWAVDGSEPDYLAEPVGAAGRAP